MNNLSIETQVRLDKFKPRDYQLPLLDAVLNKGYRKVLCLWCRRSGKDLTAWNLIIRMALQQVGNYFYCLPTYRQCRLVIFDSITIDGNKFIDYIPKELIKAINIQEMKITLINGSIIQLMGSDTYDTSLIGTNPRAIVFSEWSLSDERAYQFVRPIMNANHGAVVFLSTPRGYNHFYTLYQIAQNSKEWFCYKLTVEDCGHISLADIQREIDSSEISEDLARQEYWCDFSAGVEGSFYAKYIDRMRLKGQITDVPWEPGFQTHIAIDIGVRDSTSIIWFQCIGQTVRIIDCYQKDKEGLEHYVNVIKSKPYTMGRYIAPHDIAVKEWGSGQTRIAKAKELGIKFTLANNVGLMDGIESCRSAFGKIWIDEKNCGQLIKCLENYRQEWDSKRKVYHEKPLHDSNSHFCFVGDTKISMDKGEMPIKDIKPGMFVKTPFGIRKVLNVHKRLTNELVDITINRTVLTCTPQHNIFTQRGLVKADALRYTDIVEHNSIIRRYIWRKIYGLYSKMSDLKGFKTIFLSLKMNHKSVLMDTFLGSRETITRENQTPGQRCSVQSGCTTMVQYLKGFIFTISTAIRKTTYWIIYNVLTPKYMDENIVLGQIHGHNQKNVSNCYVNKITKQLNGIEVQRGASGIENMRKTVYPFYKDQNIHSSVSHVQKNSWVKWFGQNSVVIIVKQNIEYFSAKTLKIVIVAYAKSYSLVVNMLLRKHVVKSVRVYQPVEPKEVYDLTIEHDHCYYANGCLVSNSDAFRYMCVSLSKTRDSLSAEDLDKRYSEAMMGGSKMPRPFHDGAW